jgi:hypothetical protein
LQFTIEARELKNPHSQQTLIEADTADDAISKFVRENSSELMHVSSPGSGHESIATVRKDDSVFLVRVYAA